MAGPLRDILAPGLDVVFVGFNPGVRSGETGHHYAGRGNRFWDLLYAAGLTPVRLAPEEDEELLRYGLGSTNLVGRATPGSGDLTRQEMREGALEVISKLVELKPRLVAYMGKGVFRAVLDSSTPPRAGTMQLPLAYGPSNSGLLSGIAEFVAPNPSGRSAMLWEEKLRWFRLLAREAGREGVAPRNGRSGGNDGQDH